MLVEQEHYCSDREWKTVVLGDCTMINDSVYSLDEAWPFVNYLDTGNITDNRIKEIQHLIPGKDKIPSRARRKVRAGDIVYSTVRPNQKHFGLLRKLPENFLASTGFCVIRGNNGFVDTNYIYWVLTQDTIVQQLQAIAEHSTTAYPSIRPADIEQLKLALPPLPKQRAIAHILGTLDDKIELNHRMNETLENIAQSLFKSWFIDFDPVRAKMEGRDTGLPKHITDLFPDHLVDSELGEIPQGWGIGQISDIAVSTQRGVNPVDLVNDTPYIGLEHMPRHSIALMDWGTSNNVTSQKSNFNKGDILFGKLRPYFHKVGIAPVDGICSTDIVVMVPKDMEWFSYLLSCISSHEFVGYADSISTGTKMPRTNWKAMSRYKLCVPNTPVVLVFQNIALPMLEQIVHNIHELHTLAALRDMLHPKLLSGEIRPDHGPKGNTQ